MLRTFFLCLFICAAGTAFSQQTPKREFRAVWVATVARLDWPVSESAENQKKEFIRLAEGCRQAGINALIVQVRPAADAFYKSRFEPWSEWLAGKQGKAPGYDPLAFMIEECHKRGMELHAWFNPFRAVFSEHSNISSEHISVKKPEWIVKYGSGSLLNPGIPDARRYVLDVILDVVENYDIDAVHFDDYFYPHPAKGEFFDDKQAFAEFNPKQLEHEEWRRENIDGFIQSVNTEIKAKNPQLKFGISPVGVWRNNSEDPAGSETKGLSAYDALHADTRKWLQKGWVDYLAPQLYWSQSYPPASFDVLARWWAENKGSKHLYFGHAAYKIGNNADLAWNDKDEIPRQVAFRRELHGASGSIFYSAKHFSDENLGLKQKLRENLFSRQALLPEMLWLDSIPPSEPRRIDVKTQKDGTYISWKKAGKAPDGQKASFYALYRFPYHGQGDPMDPANLLAVLPAGEKSYWDRENKSAYQYNYAITALDRLQNESPPEQAEWVSAPESDIESVVLYPDKAEIFRNVEAKLKAGDNKLLLFGLSASILPETLLADLPQGVSLKSVVGEREENLSDESREAEKKALSDKITNEIAAAKDSLTATTLTLSLMESREGMALPKIEGDSLPAKTATEYYYQKTLSLLADKKRLENKIALLETSFAAGLDSAAKETENQAEQGNLTIELNLFAENAGEVDFEIRYFVKNASWKPLQSLIMEEGSATGKLVYQALVSQNTGSDWESVPVAFAYAAEGGAFKRIKAGNPQSILSGKQIQTILIREETLPLRMVFDAAAGEKHPNQTLLVENCRSWGLAKDSLQVFLGEAKTGDFPIRFDAQTDGGRVELGINQNISLERFPSKTVLTKKRFSLEATEETVYGIQIKNFMEYPTFVRVYEPEPQGDANQKLHYSEGSWEESRKAIRWEFVLPALGLKKIEYGKTAAKKVSVFLFFRKF